MLRRSPAEQSQEAKGDLKPEETLPLPAGWVIQPPSNDQILACASIKVISPGGGFTSRLLRFCEFEILSRVCQIPPKVWESTGPWGDEHKRLTLKELDEGLTVHTTVQRVAYAALTPSAPLWGCSKKSAKIQAKSQLRSLDIETTLQLLLALLQANTRFTPTKKHKSTAKKPRFPLELSFAESLLLSLKNIGVIESLHKHPILYNLLMIDITAAENAASNAETEEIYQKG